MNVLVVGYGSMGRRRIRLLKQIEREVRFICVDNNPARQQDASGEGHSVYGDLGEAIVETKPDLAFVCTSPGNHDAVILKLLDAAIPVFTELNLVDKGYDRILQKSLERNVSVFMSSTLLYNRVIQRICALVETAQKPLTYIYHVGQYLPDWHPWERYQDFFVGKKETNGVREIFAIQLPWLVRAFGNISSVKTEGIKSTKLEIDYPDSMTTIIRHKSGAVGVFTADVVSRKATTHLEVIGEDLHLFWDGHHDDLRVYDIQEKEMRLVSVYKEVQHQSGYADNIIEDQYLEEIRNFLGVVYRGETPRYTLEQDREILSVISKMEEMIHL